MWGAVPCATAVKTTPKTVTWLVPPRVIVIGTTAACPAVALGISPALIVFCAAAKPVHVINPKAARAAQHEYFESLVPITCAFIDPPLMSPFGDPFVLLCMIKPRKTFSELSPGAGELLLYR
jgi:hypothetical protein